LLCGFALLLLAARAAGKNQQHCGQNDMAVHRRLLRYARWPHNGVDASQPLQESDTAAFH
jgi:hypothetical protein